MRTTEGSGANPGMIGFREHTLQKNEKQKRGPDGYIEALRNQ
jgi:hypothetical protein